MAAKSLVRTEEFVADFGVYKVLVIRQKCQGVSSGGRLLDLEFDRFHLAILLDELIGSHVSATNTNQKLGIQNFDLNALGAKHILTFCKSLNLKVQVGHVEVLGEQLVNVITLDKSVPVSIRTRRFGPSRQHDLLSQQLFDLGFEVAFHLVIPLLLVQHHLLKLIHHFILFAHMLLLQMSNLLLVFSHKFFHLLFQAFFHPRQLIFNIFDLSLVHGLLLFDLVFKLINLRFMNLIALVHLFLEICVQNAETLHRLLKRRNNVFELRIFVFQFFDLFGQVLDRTTLSLEIIDSLIEALDFFLVLLNYLVLLILKIEFDLGSFVLEF